MDEGIVWLLVAVGYFVAIPAATFVSCERTHRLRWVRQTRMLRAEDDPGTPFRTGGLEPWRGYVAERRGAPAVVKVVATTSLVLGHMFVPGLLAGLVGLIYGGLGLLAVPGLILAARIYRNAFGLLRCEVQAAVEAWKLQTFAVVLNVFVLAAVAFWIAFVGLDPLAIFTTGYAIVSLLHARGLDRAARHVMAAHAPV